MIPMNSTIVKNKKGRILGAALFGIILAALVWLLITQSIIPIANDLKINPLTGKAIAPTVTSEILLIGEKEIPVVIRSNDESPATIGYENDKLTIEKDSKKIELSGVEKGNEVNIGFDTELESPEFQEVYAVDPSNADFDSALIKTIAKGSVLYKCKEWIFNEQKCSGQWNAVQDIIPGQEYTFILSKDDPGLAEGNGSILEDFESGSFSKNNWTIYAVANNWTVTNTDPYAGTYHAQARPQSTTEPASVMEINISTLIYQNITLSYYRKLVGIDAADEFNVSWKNGGSWISLENTGGNTADDASYVLKSFNLTTNADNKGNITIRFECTAGAVSEYCRVDNLQITGSKIVSNVSINSVSVPSSAIKGTDLVFRANVTATSSQVSNVLLSLNNANYSMIQESSLSSQRASMFYEGFDSGTLNTNNWNISGTGNYWGASSADPASDGFGAEAHQTGAGEPSYMEKSFSTSGYSNLTLSYAKKLVGIDVGDEFSAEFWNGTGWTSLEMTGGNSEDDLNYLNMTFNLSGSASNNPNFKIRFTCDCGAVSEYCRIDDVNVTGILSSGSEQIWTYSYKTSETGGFNYTVYANSTLGNNASSSGSFSVIEGNISIEESITDASGNHINTTIEIINLDNQTVYNQTSQNHNTGLAKGLYKIRVKPVNHSIKEMKFSNTQLGNESYFNITSDLRSLADIHQANSSQDFRFSVMPLTDSSIEVTVNSASGNALYKCLNWNFENQTCLDNNWKKIMALVPGQEYNLTIIGSDPGFKEILIINAQHLDENRAFISDIYNQTKALDNNWSEPIYSGQYVRVIFERYLSSLNDISIFPRTASGTPKIEVYENNKSEKIAEFSSISDNQYNKVYLTGLIGSQDTFDLKILNGAVQFDYITDPINTVTINFTANGTWTVPPGVTSITVEAWGAGGAGGGAGPAGSGGAGGGGGQYAKKNINVTPGQSYSITIGNGGTGRTGNSGLNGSDTSFNNTIVVAKGGTGGGANNSAVIGLGNISGSVGDLIYFGGNGGFLSGSAGGGGGGAGSTGAGGNASGITLGTGTAELGGNGGAGSSTGNYVGSAGSNYGGAGSGSRRNTVGSNAGAAGAQGFLRITFINDTDAPLWSNQNQNTSTLNPGDSVLLSVYWTDYSPLGYAILSTNETGVWENKTIYGSPVALSSNASSSNFTWKNASITNQAVSWMVYANDSYGNWNATDIMTFTVLSGNTAPYNVTLNAPLNNSQFNNTQSITFNFTAYDQESANLNCSIYLDNVLNQTNATTKNATLTNFQINGISYASHNWSINCSDSSLSNASETWTFSIADTIKPSLNITYPLNQSYAVNVSSLNYTYIDANSGSCWYSRDNGAVNSSIFNSGTNFTNIISTEGSNTWTLYCNDSFGNQNYSSVTFSKDTTPPAVNFVSPTEVSGSFVNRLYILVNVTANDSSGLSNITTYLYNSSRAVINTRVTATSPQYTNFSVTADGVYYFNSTAFDAFGNQNWTETRNVTVDTTKPLISTAYPQNTTYTFNISSFNYTVYDLNIQACWYSLNLGQTNNSVTCGQNLTGLTSTEGSNTWIVYSNDTAGNMNYSSVTFAKNVAPSVIFNYQIPADLTSLNTISIGMNISYNITDDTAVNLSTIRLYYKNNKTNSDISYYLNGTAASGYRNENYLSNISRAFLFNLYDNQVYPATYNFDERNLELAIHSIQTVTSTNSYAQIEFLNISNSTSYNFIEIMANTSSALSSAILYCNSSYLSGSPSTNVNCIQIGTIAPTTTFNHTHSAYSAHQVIPFAINTTSGAIGTVKITSTSKFMLRGTTGGWNVYYISNSSRQGAAKTTNNNGGAWTNWTYTFDSHVHQYDGTDALWYYACANDTLGNQNCTSPKQDLINMSGLPPTSPSVYSPAAGNYSGTISINYTASVSPNGYAISFYNISLVDSNETFNKTLQSNNSVNLSYIWNSAGTADGDYKIRVQACDSMSQCSSYGYSEMFSIDNVRPLISINYPLNQSYKVNVSELNYTVYDKNLQACWYTLNGTTNITIPGCANLTGLTSSEGNNTWIVYANDSAGNLNQSSVTFFKDSINPAISMTYPQNKTYTTNVSALNYTVSDANLQSCWYTLNGTVNITIPGCTNLTGLTSIEGNNTWRVYANDSLGNQNSSSVTFFKDSINPAISMTYPQNKTYTTNVSALNYTVSDANLQSCWYSLNGAANITIPGCTNLTGLTSTEGNNTWIVYANDSAGNLNQSSVTFFKDTIKPLVSITYPANTTYTTNVSALNYTIYDLNLQACWYSLNGAANQSVTCGQNLTNLTSTEGSNIWAVYSNDSAGNWNYSSVTFYKDTIKPSITIVSPANTTYMSRTILVNITRTETGSTWYNWNGTNTTYTDPESVFFNEGSNTLTAYANDSLNNVNSTQVTFFVDVDTTAPVITLIGPANNSEDSNGFVTFRYNVTDAHLVDSCKLIINGSINDTRTNVSKNIENQIPVSGIAEGNYSWSLNCTDNYGNNASSETWLFRVKFPANYTNATIIVNTTIVDGSGNPVNATIQFIDSSSGQTDYNTTSGNSTGISSGIFNIQVTPQNNVIKSITFINVSVTGNVTSIVNFEDTPNTGNWKEIYSVNPLLNYSYSSISIIVTSKSNKLFKCENWNFTSQKCSDNKWKKLMSIVSGQNYTITMLNSTDPGFAEGNNTIYVLDKENYLENYTESIIANSSGLLNVKLTPANHSIQQIIVYEHNEASANDDLKIDSVSTDMPPQYAIDPSTLNFTNATVSVTAKETLLYKCVDWNFSSQECLGNWTLIQTLTAGQQYNYTLNSTDPSLRESGNYSVFEDFESGSFSKNNWTLTSASGAANWTVSTTNPFAGTYHAQSGPGSSTIPASTMQTNISTYGFRNITFSYYRRLVQLDLGQDSFNVSWYNGTNWIYVEGAAAAEAAYSFRQFNLTQDATNNPEFKIRFECTANQGNEFCRVDNINVSGQNSAPNVTLNYPAAFYVNDTESPPVTVLFNCSVTEDVELQNISLYITNSNNQSFALNQTASVTGKSNSTIFSVDLKNGNYTWNCLAYDAGGLYDWADSNRSVKINYTDNVAPTINFTNPTTQSGNYSQSWIAANVTAFDINLADITIYLYNSTGLFNSTSLAATNSTGNLFANFTDLLDGIYYLNATATDGVGNLNKTETRIIVLDTAAPLISIISPANTTYNNRTLLVNISTSGALNVWFYNGTANESYTGTVYRTFAENSNTIIAYANDSAGNFNQTSRTFSIDTTFPLISMNYPQNTTYTVNVSELNYTVSDTNIQACWYSLNLGQTNNSVTCGQNLTGLASTEGSNTWTVYSNDSAGNMNYSRITFSKDTINPSISMTYPQNTTYTTNVSALNYTVSDTNLQSCWYTLNGGANTPITCGQNLTNLTSTEGSNTWAVYANDSFGNLNSSSITFSKDTINPSINFTYPTEISGSILKRNNILVNVSANDTNFANITINLYNQTALINTAASALKNHFVNFTGLADGIYYFNSTAFDVFENYNSTETRNVTIDTKTPVLTIYSPLNKTYGRRSVLVNFTADSYQALWFNNETADVAYTGPVYVNVSDGSHTFILYANDSAGNLNTTYITFSVDTKNPQVTINSPINKTYNNATITVDILAINVLEDGIDSVWFNWNGTNTTYNSPINITFNENSNTLYAFANDTAGNIGTNNVTFIVDTIPPALTVYSPVPMTYITSTLLINFTATDLHGISSLWYYNGTSNVSYTSSNTIPIGPGSYNWIFYANDTVNNVNFTSVNFDVFEANSPKYSNIAVSPSSPANYSIGQNYQFNVTWTEDTEMGIAIFSFNGTNYTMNNASNVYSYTLNNLAAGNYTYYFWANDTFNNKNQTSVFNYTINKAPGNVSLKLNGSESDINAVYGAQINASASSATGAVTLYKNGANADIENNAYVLLGVNYYNYTAVASETQNYTSASISRFVNITQAMPSLGILFTPSASVTYPTNTTANGTGCPAQLTCNLYRNNASVSNPDTGILGRGVYEYTYNTTGNQNYTYYSISQILNVSQNITSITVSVNPSMNVEYGTQTTATCSINNGQAYNFTRNSFQITSPDVKTLAVGAYNYTCLFAGNENYSYSIDSKILNVSKAAGVIYTYLNNTRSNLTIVEGTSILLNATLINGTGTIYLYNNGTLINSGSSPLSNNTLFSTIGTYNITSIYNGNENYTADSETFYVKVVDPFKPTINFTSPTEISGSMFNRKNIRVNVTANDTNFAGITINIYNSSGYLVNSTTSVSSPYFVNFTNLADGLYYFNATAYDISGNENSTETRNVTVNTQPPAIAIISPANTTYTNRTILVNITRTETGSTWYNWNGTNVTYTNPEYVIFNETGNKIYAYANDTIGNLNSTSVTFYIDSTKPLVQFVAPTTTTGDYSQNWIAANATAYDLNLQSLTIYLYNSTALVSSASSGTSPLFINFTNLADGGYTLVANASDTAGNKNSTSIGIVLDTANPAIQFVSPTESSGSLINRSNAKINVSTSDSHSTNITIYLYNSTGLINSSSATAYNLFANFANLNNGVYYFNATATDFVNNKNYTETRNFTVDISAPVFNTSQTRPALNTFYAEDTNISLRVNTTDNLGISSVTANISWDSTSQAVLLSYNSGTGFYESVFSSTSQIGVYNITFTAIDTAGNSNTTFTNFTVYDAINPVIVSTNISNYAPIINETFFMNMSATDNVAIGSLYANITLPNGTAQIIMLPSYYNATMPGRYNITFTANDTSGNIATYSDYFIAGINVSVQFNVINYNNSGVSNTLKIYLADTNRELHAHDFTGVYLENHAGILYDLLFNAYSNSIEIMLRSVNISLDNNKTLGIDKLGTPASDYIATYGINSTYSIANATIKINYSALTYSNEDYLRLYKCANWNFESRTCSGSWALTAATQDKTLKTFTLDVSGFSGFSIKEEAAPAVIPTVPGIGGGAALPPCTENWTCTDWNCTDGYAYRKCTDLNKCYTESAKPAESAECVRIPGCFNKKKDGLETDIDCGGSCPKCLIGQDCKSDNDCTSNICTEGKCTTEAKPEERPAVPVLICWWVWMLILLSTLAVLLVLNLIDSLTKPTLKESINQYIRAEKKSKIAWKPIDNTGYLEAKVKKIKHAEHVTKFSSEIKGYLKKKYAGVLHKEKIAEQSKLSRMIYAFLSKLESKEVEETSWIKKQEELKIIKPEKAVKIIIKEEKPEEKIVLRTPKNVPAIITERPAIAAPAEKPTKVVITGEARPAPEHVVKVVIKDESDVDREKIQRIVEEARKADFEKAKAKVRLLYDLKDAYEKPVKEAVEKIEFMQKKNAPEKIKSDKKSKEDNSRKGQIKKRVLADLKEMYR